MTLKKNIQKSWGMMATKRIHHTSLDPCLFAREVCVAKKNNTVFSIGNSNLKQDHPGSVTPCHVSLC